MELYLLYDKNSPTQESEFETDQDELEREAERQYDAEKDDN